MLKQLAEKRAAEKRLPLTIAVKAKTIARIEELAKQANLSVSFLASEILDLGVTVGDSIEVVGQELQGFVSNLLQANQVLEASKKAQKKSIKPVRRTTKKPVKFGGRR